MRTLKAPADRYPELKVREVNADDENAVLELAKEVIGKGHETAITNYLQTHEKRLNMLKLNGFTIVGDVVPAAEMKVEVKTKGEVKVEKVEQKEEKFITVLTAKRPRNEDVPKPDADFIFNYLQERGFIEPTPENSPKGDAGLNPIGWMRTQIYNAMLDAMDQVRRQTPNPSGQRPAVVWFAGEMEKKLKENDHKGGWADMTFDELYLRVKKEMQELLAADMVKKSPEAIIKECADIANYCLFIADLQAHKYGK